MIMKLLITFLLITGTVFASNEKRPELPNYRVLKNEVDSSLKKREAAFTIMVGCNYTDKEIKKIIYADNGEQSTVRLDKDYTFDFITKPGKHKLEFSIGEHHHEIIIDSIAIEKRHRITISLNFKHSTHQMMVRKPVIYLYPDEKTAVNVKVDPVGEMIFTYPLSEGEWNVIASPDGTLSFKDEIFNYLFWESEQVVPDELIDYSKGAFVKGENLTTHFEKVLKTYGLNSQERADFITYWVPLMKDANNLYLYLLFDETCDAFASLEIEPKPDHIGRIYVLWDKVEDSDKIELTPQEIPVLDRTGFTVIEWGGAQINYVKQPDKRL